MSDAYAVDVKETLGRKERSLAGKRAAEKARELDRIQPVMVEGRPDILPARVVYTLDGNLVSAMPGDIDLPPPEYVTVPYRRGRLPNGLTLRSDAMARMMARGYEGTRAYRDAYNDRRTVPRVVTERVLRIVSYPAFKPVCDTYRYEMQREQAQRVIPIKTYVTGRLVDESQMAEQASARIRALELLGKSVSLFTDVRRVETFTSSDVDRMKTELYQRLNTLAQRMRISPSQGEITDSGLAEPTYTPSPLVGMGPIQREPITNTLSSGPNSSSGTPSGSPEDLSGWGDVWAPEVANPSPEGSLGTPVHNSSVDILEIDPEYL